MLSVYPPAPPGGSDDQLYHLAGFSRTPRIPGLRGTTFNGSLYSGFLAQLVALLSSLNGYPNRPANKPRRSHHRPRRLQPSARPLPGAYHFQLSTKSSIPGRYSAPNETQAQSILGNVVPATSRGRRLHPPDTPPPPPRERLFCLVRLQPELRSECGGGAVPRGGFGVPSPIGEKGTTLPRLPCAEPEPAASLCVTAAGWS